MLVFAAISLINPWMMAGLTLLSLPVIAHFLNRGARRPYHFPSIRLLQECAATQVRLTKLRRLLLLLLRCLLLAAIVAAFARPVWRSSRTAGGEAIEGIGLAIVLDVSASTAQSNGGVALTQTALGAASRTLDAMRLGQDMANVIVATGQPESLQRELIPNLTLLRSQLSDLEVTYERADMQAAIGLAGQQLSRHPGPRRLVLISDLQRTNFQDMSVDSLRGILPSDTRVTVVDLKSDVDNNLALHHARCFPSQPLEGQPAIVSVDLTNYSPQKKQVPITARRNEDVIATQTVQLDAGQQREVSFELTLPDRAQHAITFEIPADGLMADNRACLVVTAASRPQVLVISDDDAEELGGGTYFLHRALAPHDGTGDVYDVRMASSRELTEVPLETFRAVFIEYVGDLSDTAARKILAYIGEGGGVVFFCGEGPVRQNLTKLDTLSQSVGVPWLPGPRRSVRRMNDAMQITSGRWRSKLLRDFDEASQIAMGQIRFERVWSMGTIRPDAEVLLSFADNTPALVSGTIGAGKLVLANCTASATSSDLGKHGAFVALVQILAKSLGVAGTASPEHLVGQPCEFAFPVDDASKRELLVRTAEGEKVPFEIMETADQGRVQLRRPPQPGLFRLMKTGRPVDALAINLDPRESDLRRIAPEEVQPLFAQAGADTDVDAAGATQPLANVKGRPLWNWMLGLAVFACSAELFLLGWWRR